MLLTRRHIQSAIESYTSDISARVQRLESEQAMLRARVEGERQVRSLAANVTAAAVVAPAIGAAIERFAEAMRRPSPRGRAGGLARVRTAWRYFDGRFMPESNKSEAYRMEYERYAAGGRARAACARRSVNGRFI